MKHLNIFILLVVLLLNSLATSTHAQYKDVTFEKGKLQLLDKSKLKLNDVSFSDTAVHAILPETGEMVTVPYYELNKVKVLGNNRAFWKGFGIGLLCSVAYTTIVVIEEGNPFDLEHYTSGFIRTAPFFGFLGGAVGLTFRKYDYVPLDVLQSPDQMYGNLNAFRNYQLGFTYRF